MTEAQVRKLLAREIKAMGLRAFCREHDLDPSFVARVRDGDKLSPAILSALGVDEAGTVTTYRKIK